MNKVRDVGCTINRVDKRYLHLCVNWFMFDVNGGRRSVVCLRDSGSQSLESKQLIEETEFRETGEARLLKVIKWSLQAFI